MTYIIKKMFNNIISNPSLRGINIINNNINIPTYPSNTIDSLHYAASIHKNVRKYIQPFLRPNMKLLDIAELMENKIVELANQDKSINRGIGFPVLMSVNNCAAHSSPYPNETTVINTDDVIKIDFGTEANGWIIDSAFTISFNPIYDNLLDAVKDATYTGIKNAHMDASIDEWSGLIQETMESYEIELNNKIYPIRVIENIGGHNILQGIIHGGTFLSCVPRGTKDRFKEGVYAIETFGSTGDNIVKDEGSNNLYRLKKRVNSSNKMYKKIVEQYNTLPFTDRLVKLFNINNYQKKLKELVDDDLLFSYPPLCVNKDAYTAQYEHTVYIGENKKIVFSEWDDY